MATKNPSVDGYIRKNKAWQAELEALRAILLEAGLTEDIKWRAPCYTHNGANLVIIGAEKDNVVLSFLKGVLLKDEHHILQCPGENSRIAKKVDYRSMDDIQRQADIIRAYVREAIALEDAGVKVDLTQDRELPIPEELQAIFDQDSAFEEAFFALTPGRQRGWLIHFNSAKQSKTRTTRIEKARPRIHQGLGWNDYTK